MYDRAILKATVILLPLLGLTWIFGLLAINEDLTVFAWIFTVLNSSQVRFSNGKITWLYYMTTWLRACLY